MADYARPGGQARWMRSQGEQIRRLRTRRPLRGHVPAPTWALLGEIPEATMPPLFIPVDPFSEGDYPEYKRIVAVDGRLESGSVTINWFWDGDWFYEGHVITPGGDNRIELPTPYIIDGTDGGEWIGPDVVDSTSGVTLSATIIVETVPI